MQRRAFVFLLLGITLVDRLTKMVMVNGWEWSYNLVHLQRFDNHGLVFSIPSSPAVAIVLMSLVIVSVMVWLWQRRHSISTEIFFAAGCVLVGAVSNLLDRILYGVVIDWISFGRWFPIFNIADLSIFFGVIVWIRNLTNKKEVS